MLWARWRAALHGLADLRRESRLKVAVIASSTVILAAGLFAGAYGLFAWLGEFGGEVLVYGEPRLATLEDLSESTLDRFLLGRLLGVFALSLLAFLVLSNLVVAYGTLFRSREVAFLLQSPIPPRSLFLGRFLEAVALSSWASAFLGLPILLAYGLASGAPAGFYWALAAVFPPFVLVPAALGSILALGLARLVPEIRRRLPRSAWTIPAALVALTVPLYLFFRRRLGALEVSGESALQALVAAMGRPEAGWLPSTWASRTVLAAADGEAGVALANLAALSGLATALVALAAWVSARLHAAAWDAIESRGAGGLGSSVSSASSASSARGRPRASRFSGGLERLLAWIPEPGRSLVVKDLRTFWRDPAQWSQFLLFFGLMALYAATVRRTSVAYEADLWQGVITLLNGTAGLLVLATLTTRFVFPLISLEGRRFWILGLAPLTRRHLVAQKFVLSVATTSVFTVGLALVTGLRLGLGTGVIAVTVATAVMATVALSGLAVGLGGLYPSFGEESAARIVSGLGGTLTFVLSLGFILVVASVQALLLQTPLRERLLGEIAPALAHGAAVPLGLGALALLSGVTAAVPLALAVRNLERLEL